MKKLSSAPNTLIFIWLKGFILISFPVILYNITVPCLFCEMSSEVTAWPFSESLTSKVPLQAQGWFCSVLKYVKMFKYAGNAAKLYSKVSSVIWTENLKPGVNINQKPVYECKLLLKTEGCAYSLSLDQTFDDWNIFQLETPNRNKKTSKKS